MTERDPFERDLGQSFAPPPAPEALRRRVAGIPAEHPRRTVRSWRRWFDSATMPWAASLTAAFASLAIGIWIGASGVADVDNAGPDDELTAMAFPAAGMMGDDL